MFIITPYSYIIYLSSLFYLIIAINGFPTISRRSSGLITRNTKSRRIILLSAVSSKIITNIEKEEIINMSETKFNGNGDIGIAARLARKNILELAPYRCARDDYSEGILLDANENAFGPPLEKKDETILERYPDPYQIPLKEKVLKFRGYDTKLTPSNVFVGVGSDEAIDLLMRIFCKPGIDKILITPPTYGMYKVCAKVNDIDIINVPLTPDFDVQIQETLDAITPEVKLLFLCSPGNPTAKAIPLSDIETIAKDSKASNCIIVIDEAYIDFTNTDNHKSGLELIKNGNNVVVLQTLSKAFGLAAIRCGFCFGSADVIQLMNNVKAPYNVNTLTSQMAINALDNISILNNNIQNVLQERNKVMYELNNMEYVTKVYPSDSNFILFRLIKNAKEIYKYMADNEQIVTRYRGTELHCNECIRVTIGTPEENNAFLIALQKAYKELDK